MRTKQAQFNDTEFSYANGKDFAITCGGTEYKDEGRGNRRVHKHSRISTSHIIVASGWEPDGWCFSYRKGSNNMMFLVPEMIRKMFLVP
jgi:hypothetical protein